MRVACAEYSVSMSMTLINSKGHADFSGLGCFLGQCWCPIAIQSWSTSSLSSLAELAMRTGGIQPSPAAAMWGRGPCALHGCHSRAGPGGVSTGELNNSDATQAQEWGFELSHPNNYPMDELPELGKSLLLQNQSCRISITQGSNRISKRNPGEDPVLIVRQKPRGLEPDQSLTAMNICK